jgi:hypothetical protein
MTVKEFVYLNKFLLIYLNQWTPCLWSGMITCGRNVKPMPTPRDARWFVIDRAVMAYKGTETDVLYGVEMAWRDDATAHALLTRGILCASKD